MASFISEYLNMKECDPTNLLTRFKKFLKVNQRINCFNFRKKFHIVIKLPYFEDYRLYFYPTTPIYIVPHYIRISKYSLDSNTTLPETIIYSNLIHPI